MTEDRTIRSSKSIAEVRRIVRTLPRAVSLKDIRHTELGLSFVSGFVHSLLGSAHKAFLQKSKGLADLGEKWKPLRPATIARKTAKRRRQGRSSPLSVHMTKNQKTIFDQTYTASLASFRTAGVKPAIADQSATRRAWDRLMASKAGSPLVPIGIDTGQLERAVRPGTVSATTYSPPQNQTVKTSPGKIKVSINVPHAGQFNRVRPVFPPVSKIRPWFRAAVIAGRDRVLTAITQGVV